MSRKHWKLTMSAAATAAILACSSAAFADDDYGKLDDTNKPHSADMGTAISDTGITAKVKSKLTTDTRLDNTNIDVTTANGVVTLTGSAPSMKAKRAATDLAKNVKGVIDVDNRIVTPAGAEISSVEAKSDNAVDKAERIGSDSWITTKVKGKLLADHRTKGMDISVRTEHHVVYLSGTVSSKAELDSAKQIAHAVKHVKSVNTSELKIGS